MTLPIFTAIAEAFEATSTAIKSFTLFRGPAAAVADKAVATEGATIPKKGLMNFIDKYTRITQGVSSFAEGKEGQELQHLSSAGFALSNAGNFGQFMAGALMASANAGHHHKH